MNNLTATEIAGGVRRGTFTAAAVVDASLARIGAVNPQVNAVTVVLAEQAREAAAALDARIAAGQDPGPLAGVPISVKENIDLTWSATTSGLPFAAGNVPAANATFVDKLLAAGAIPVARGNMPDIGLRWDTDNDLFGRTVNPWDDTRVPGGSSGGDAVAVATGMVAAGLGNDYGGSLRLPAHAAGITALRTSAGRVAAPSRSVEPLPLSIQHMAVNGPLARSVADLDLLFGVMHGADDVDPLSVTVEHPSGYAGPRRVAVTVDPAGWGVDPQTASAVRAAAAALAAAGWDVEEVEPPSVDRCATLWRQLSSTENAPMLLTPGIFPGPLSAGTVQYFKDNIVDVELLDTSAAYQGAWAERFVHAAAWRAFHARYPIVLGPVTTQPMPLIGFDLSGPAATTALWKAHRLLVTANFLGLPAVAVPTGVTGRRPLGVQVIARLHGEHIALAAARDLEDAFPPIRPF
ncbi:amidase family protein [Actinoplanes awajinensis]|uniref:Amidase n=1 Tax=Actinoplanes awajinensis subsp. mycoplanecinus TaxID=135947 RepID=A0A0X3VBP9_9ACTN|nr:amidase family protein [Actinoplanes awajinensis]KUL42118.1 amidase [Actinoplanes awajinensis subsp. mycoplanecinus]